MRTDDNQTTEKKPEIAPASNPQRLFAEAHIKTKETVEAVGVKASVETEIKLSKNKEVRCSIL